MGPKKKASEGKKHRKILSIEQKKEIIAKHLEGVKVMQLARIYETSHSTISTILAMKEELMVAKVAKGTSRLNVRGVLFEEMENLLLIWIKKREMVGDTISQSAICQKAKQIYQDLKNKTPGSSSEVNDDFKASRGWFDNFKKRTGIHSVVRYREADSADKAAAKKFVNSFARIIGGEYLSQQVFNCNETGLFWKKMPNRTFITKEVEEDDDEELSEMHDQELITDDLKELYKQQCEEKEVEISSEDEDGEKEQIMIEIKKVLAKWKFKILLRNGIQ